MANVKKVTLKDIADKEDELRRTLVENGRYAEADAIASTVENVVEKPAIAAVETIAEDDLHVPAVARPAINTYLDNHVGTRIFALTNLATHEFIPIAGRFIVEIESSLIAEAEVKTAIEAKFLKDTGIRLLNNALHYIELTGAKVLPHVKD